MKRKGVLSVLLTLMLILSLSLVACGENDGGGNTPPTQSQWESVGISGTFDVEVKGVLSQSIVSENNEISMKWEGSDEESLDNTIDWLKEQGYDSYGGASAQKTTEEGGKIISYTAEKTVDGAITMSAGDNVAVISLSAIPFSTGGESKNMIAETFYITENFSIMGVNFKAGELYLDIYEDGATPSSVLDAWPSSQIQSVIGDGVPVYSGEENGFQFINSSISYIKTVQINVFGASEGDATAYANLLSQNGYVSSDGQTYEKTLVNGNVIQIMAFVSQTYHPESFQIVDVVCITVMLEKNSGTYSSWSALNLSEFSGANVPAFSGGTSFDIDDAVGENGGIDLTEYEQIIATLGALEGFLDDEQRGQLEEARQYIALASQIKSSVVTVYGTNVQEVEAYEDALINAGFVDGMKNTATHQYQIDVSEDEGKAVIAITKLPIELADEINDNGGGSSSSSVGKETVDWNDLPSNLKFTFVDSVGNNYTLTKKGNDYLINYFDAYIFLKATNSGWIMYTYSAGSWVEADTIERIDENTAMNTISYVLFDNDLSDYVKGASEQVAGVTCDVYTYGYDSYGISMSYVKKVNADGIVFYSGTTYSMSGQTQTMTSQISAWDTNVSSFDITPPQ